MPVSEPSYFPPNRSNGSIVGISTGVGFVGARSFLSGTNAAGAHCTLNDIIIIGDNAFKAGATESDLSGTIVLGSGAAPNLQGSAGAEFAGPSVIIGFEALASTPFGDADVIIGAFAAQHTFVANQAGNGGGNVIIGFAAAQFQNDQSLLNNGMSECVVIGAGAAKGTGVGGQLSDSVLIGHRVLTSSDGNVNNCLIIGWDAFNAVNTTLVDITALGNGISATSPAQVVALGEGINMFGSDHSLLIGRNVSAGGSWNMICGPEINCGAGSHNVYIGAFANQGGTGHSNRFLIETGEGSLPRRLFVGDFGSQAASDGGNLILGDSANLTLHPGADTFPTGATNIVKLINGTVGSTNPQSGGYFYVNAGALHWVGSSGTDTVVAPA